jgi:hypothetical protein
VWSPGSHNEVFSPTTTDTAASNNGEPDNDEDVDEEYQEVRENRNFSKKHMYTSVPVYIRGGAIYISSKRCFVLHRR